MALSILDGNQSATTLSTILSSGQHITAHTVVSLGTQAITDMRGAVSGSVVSISNFPASQVISGTVTANPTGTQTIAGTVTANVFGVDYIGTLIQIPVETDSNYIGDKFIPIGFNADSDARQVSNSFPLPIQAPNGIAISGTVTANLGSALPTGTNRIGVVTIGGGTVTIGAGTSQIGSVTASISNTVPVSISSVTVGNSVTIASLPAISGTVTANLSISSTAITSGSFTSLTSATLIPANTARKMATVYNLGAGQLFVNAGATATTLGGGFMVALSSGDFYECDYTTTTLSAIFATAGTASWVSH